ncbi:MAG: nucleotidyltransferase family protein [Lachnospiraceae bacterium]|nr:nucleotidyltransferase family protein [Lachnospiraceae bacterium]
MKVTGIIAEYNPFHNGHKLHIDKAREMTEADYIIVAMSGDFVQRGVPAIMDKRARAEAALNAGADLVLEIPCVYATGSAPYFAMGGVSLLDKLGVCDALCFGSESGDIKAVNAYSAYKPDNDAVKEALKSGMTYPAALDYLSEKDGSFPRLAPNDLLAAAYCKAIKTRKSPISPCIIKRQGASYGERALTGMLSSATAIRLIIESEDTFPEAISSAIPYHVYEKMNAQYGLTFPVKTDDFSSLLYSKLRNVAPDNLIEYLDVTRELSDRIQNKLPAYDNWSSFTDLIKTKNVTFTRVSRSFAHILLNIRKDDMLRYEEQDYVLYARMLGFKKESAPLLTAISENTSIPLISKLADAGDSLSDLAMQMLDTDLLASDLYRYVIRHTFHTSLPDEYRAEIIRV